jgi:hypothetical protein
MKSSSDSVQQLRTKPDRVVFTSTGPLVAALGALTGFRTVGEHGLRNVNDGFFCAPYARVRELVSETTDTKMFVRHCPRFRRLASLRVAVAPEDMSGQLRPELEGILHAFSPYRLRIIEVAIDFPASRGINAQFIRRHLRCGKARMRPNKNFPEAVWFGVPKSDQFVRCYPKASINGFRVEVQFNRGAIERYGLDDLRNWGRLPEVVMRHMRFFEVAW